MVESSGLTLSNAIVESSKLRRPDLTLRAVRLMHSERAMENPRGEIRRWGHFDGSRNVGVSSKVNEWTL